MPPAPGIMVRSVGGFPIFNHGIAVHSVGVPFVSSCWASAKRNVNIVINCTADGGGIVFVVEIDVFAVSRRQKHEADNSNNSFEHVGAAEHV